MRRFVSVIAGAAALCGVVGGAVMLWRRNPRVGTAFVNSVVNPRLAAAGSPAAAHPRSARSSTSGAGPASVG